MNFKRCLHRYLLVYLYSKDGKKAIGNCYFSSKSKSRLITEQGIAHLKDCMYEEYGYDQDDLFVLNIMYLGKER